jgi:hypothetical protein
MIVPEGRRVGEEDAALDAMLASWAQSHAPSPEGLEAIRRNVLDEVQMAGDTGLAEAILPLAWWEGFFADLEVGFRRAVSLESVLAAAGCAA